MREFINLVEQNLFELREYLDTNYYGSWVNSETREVLKVPRGYHHNTVMAPRCPPEVTEQLSMTDVYIWAFENNWVRVTHDPSESLSFIAIQGMPDDIKHAWPIIRPSVMVKLKEFDTVNVAIDLVKGTKFKWEAYQYSEDFKLPADKNELLKFMKSPGDAII